MLRLRSAYNAQVSGKPAPGTQILAPKFRNAQTGLKPVLPSISPWLKNMESRASHVSQAGQRGTAVASLEQAARSPSEAPPPRPAPIPAKPSQMGIEVKVSTAESIAEDVRALRANFRQGVTRDLEARRRTLEALAKMLREQRRAIQDALWKDMHKPPAETLISELAALDSELQAHLDYLNEWAAPEKVWTNLANLPGSAYIYKEPLGVVCLMGTWNYPVQLTIWPLIGAIAAGNCVLLRLPADDTCVHTTELLYKIVSGYVNRQVVRVVHGNIPATQAMLSHKFDLILATGGTTIGKIVAEAAAKTLTPTILELGGKSPTIVDETCNIDVTAKRLTWAAFLNCGQSCVRPDYIMVSEKIGDQLVAAIEKNIKTFFGDDAKESGSYCRLGTDRFYARVAAMLDKDAKFVTFGGERDGADNFIAPTVLNFKRDFSAFKDSAVMQEEIFGPLMPIYYYESIDEAIDYVNEGAKPLALYVYSSKSKVQERVLLETSSGTACINDSMVQNVNLNLPFGGVGASGMGAYHGKHSFDAFSHKKGVQKKYWIFDAAQRYMPYTNSNVAILKLVMRPLPRDIMVMLIFSIFAFVFTALGLLIQDYRLSESDE